MGKKILVVSDNHGSKYNLKMVVEEWKDKIDAMVHCGDSEFSVETLNNMVPVPVYSAEGNCDFGFDGDRESLFEIGGHVCFVTHGHRYGVSWGDDELVEKALEMGADIVFYGHTHMPAYQIYQDENVTVLNPGSIARPRQFPREATFLVVDLKEDGRIIPQFYTIS